MSQSQQLEKYEYTIPCKGIVAYSEHDWRFEDLLTREPLEDEFLIEVIATGVCHTDISGYGGIYPRVLGHEGAGRVLRTGSPHVSSLFAPGDLVILSASSCEKCHYCVTSHPAYCVSHAAVTLLANAPNFVLASDPSSIIGGGYFGQSTFASPTPVKISCASNVTRLVRGVEELKLYAPLGCGIMTGAGAITHVGMCGRGDVVGVVGLGGVGLAAVAAAKERGVGTIVAVDVVESRITLARSMGATHTLLSTPSSLQSLNPTDSSLSTAIKRLTPQHLGCTHILDTTPSVAVLEQCMEALQKNGTLLQVGVKPVGAKLEIDLLTHMVNGRKLVGVIEGDRDPKEALPELVAWCKDGVLDIGAMVKGFPVREFKEAREKMESGVVVKGVLIW